MAEKETIQAPETVSKADFDAAIERARRFEGQLTDLEKKFEKVKAIDPEKYTAIIEENRILKTKDAGSDETKITGLVESARKEERELFTGKLTETSKQRDELLKEVNHYKVTVPATNKLAEKKLLPEQLPLMQMLVEKELFLHDGEIRILGKDGKPERSKLNPAKDMDIEEWTDSLVQKYPSAFAASSVPGGREPGKAHTATNGNGLTVEKFAAMTPQQRSQVPTDVHRKLSAQLLGMATRQTVPVKNTI